MKNLFSEFEFKGLKVKNRIVMPPMVCFGEAKEDGLVTDNHIKHYAARAKGGAGLIIIEAASIDPKGRLVDSQLGLWSDRHIDGIRKTVEACRLYNVGVIVQIGHAGFKTPRTVNSDLVSSSEYNQGGISARALSIDEIHFLQEKFVEAAIRAKKAGADGVELHGAHGYLISQFLSPLVNKREDGYGGSTIGEARFVTEIIKKIREVNGEDFIISCRMGGNEPSLENGIAIAKELEKNGIDLLHVSSGMTSNEVHPVPKDFEYSWIVYYGTQIKQHVNVPVIVVNRIRTPERANNLIEHNLADFAAIGKGMLVDPEWANKAVKNINVHKCLECPSCSWFKSGNLCPGHKSSEG